MDVNIAAVFAHLRVPIIRWPGGAFANDYHWRAGVGPIDERPTTVNSGWQECEPNTFGTNEFLQSCAQIGAAPLITMNLETGTPKEALDWVEYCQFPGSSSLTALRAKHGRIQPHAIPYWIAGSLCQGKSAFLSAADYAKEAARFIVPMSRFDPQLQFLLQGMTCSYEHPNGENWNQELCEALRGQSFMNYLCLEPSFTQGGGATFSNDDYDALFAHVITFEEELEKAEALLHYYFPKGNVALAVTEWGMKHPEASLENGMEQPNTLRDALFAASMLHLFNKWSPRVAIANLNQAVNVLQCLMKTRPGDLLLTPTFHVFDLMIPHYDALRVRTEVETPSFEVRESGSSTTRSIPCLDVSASLSENTIRLTVINKSRSQTIKTRIELGEAKAAAVSGTALLGATPQDQNTFEDTGCVRPHRLHFKSFKNAKDEVVHSFPPHSFTALTITLES